MSDIDQYLQPFDITTELFAGPIDLLMHLVKKRELPLEKVSLAEVTAQYLECIRTMKYFDLEMAGEYLVIAATLVSIKAKILLNEPVEMVSDENGDLVDPAEELLKQLRLLESYKDVTRSLSSRPLLGIDVFSTLREKPVLSKEDVPLAEHDALLLAKAFRTIIDRAQLVSKTLTFSVDTVTIVERMMSVLEKLKTLKGSTSFESLLENAQDRGILVSTFVALLELCRRSAIKVSQDTSLGQISISLADGSAARLEMDEAEKVAINQ